MRRPLLASLLTAAVIGASGGTVVANRLGDDRGDAGDVGADGNATDPAAAPAGWPSRQLDGRPDRRYDEPLWIDSVGIHDGDEEPVRPDPALPIDPIQTGVVDKAPFALQRFVDGWVVNVGTAETSTVYVVGRDGASQELATVAGLGDVSPDGTAYVAQLAGDEGYGIFDLGSGERTDLVATGTSANEQPTGRAEFVGDDTVATGWRDAEREAVVLAPLGSAERTVVADDLAGPWTISPDGAWLAGSRATEEDGERVAGCVVLRRVDGEGRGRTDCGGTLIPSAGAEAMPTFDRDSREILTEDVDSVLGDPDFGGDPRFRPVSVEGASPERIDAPRGVFYAFLLTSGRVVTLGAEDYENGSGARVALCRTGGGCEDLAVSSMEDSFFVALGRPY